MAAKESKKEKKNFVWYSLRISFILMVALLIFSLIFPNIKNIFLNIIFLVSLIFALITSVIHLVKYKKKGFAIVALVVSSLILFLYAIGLAVVL